MGKIHGIREIAEVIIEPAYTWHIEQERKRKKDQEKIIIFFTRYIRKTAIQYG